MLPANKALLGRNLRRPILVHLRLHFARFLMFSIVVQRADQVLLDQVAFVCRIDTEHLAIHLYGF